MTNGFDIERLWVPAGEGAGTVGDNAYLLSMADSPATFVEWGADGRRRRARSLVSSGDIWVWPHEQTWWTRLEAGKTCIHLSLSSEWFHQTMLSSVELQPQVQLRDRLLAHLLRMLADAAETFPRNPTTNLYQESLATTLVLHLATHHAQTAGVGGSDDVTPLPSAQLRAITDYISDHLSGTITLADLTHLAGLSASRFSPRFRAATGQTPHQFVTSMRVDRARELLSAGQHTLTDVAALTGFADQSHLTRHVRRAFGVTPGALRRR